MLLNVVLVKTLEYPLDCKKIKPVNPKGNQPRMFIGKTFADAEAQVLWPPDGKSQLIRKSLMLGKIESRRRRKWQWWNGWIASLTRWTLSLSELQELVMDREAWRPVIHRNTKSRTLLSDWTKLNWTDDMKRGSNLILFQMTTYLPVLFVE